LVAFPALARIDDFFVRTELDDKYEDATLRLALDVTLREDCEVSVLLRDGPRGAVISTDKTSLSAGVSQASRSLSVPNPHKWTAETPRLYTLEIKLYSGGEESRSLRQEITHRVGFRSVELKNGNICVNGRPITFRGVNRHDHHPRRGRAVPWSFVRNDVLLMKRHNINAVRCSHYPSHPGLVGLCDELGLWVIDEADLECHGFSMVADAALERQETTFGNPA